MPTTRFLNSRHLNELREAKERLSNTYLKPSLVTRAQALKMPVSPQPSLNVRGVGIGEKIVGGRFTGQLAVKLFVRRKFPLEHIGEHNLLPRMIRGLPVDVEEVGLVHAFAAAPNPKAKLRPAQPGCSIGFQDPSGKFIMAGTFGALVQDAAARYILSNNHVLADENKLAIGAPIFQPGLLDGGNSATDQIAALTRFIPLLATGTIDCAIAKLTASDIATRFILGIGSPTGSEEAALDMVVHKCGRTTGYTVGRVSSVDTDISVQYDMGTLTFKGQIAIAGLDGTAFSDAGDSGSLIVNRADGKAVGLLFAGGPSTTFANHITDVLQALGVTLVLASPTPAPRPAPSPQPRPVPVPRPQPPRPAPSPNPQPPRPGPTPVPTPPPTPTPTPPPTPTPTPSPAPTPTPPPTPTPTPPPTPTPTPPPSPAPTPAPTPAPAPAPTPAPTPAPSPAPTPAPTPSPSPDMSRHPARASTTKPKPPSPRR